MRIYDPKQWFNILFQFHKSDTLRKLLLLILIIAAYTGVLVFFLKDILHVDANDHIRNLSILHTLLGLVLSLLLVFRTNTAYDRWWEGRKLWGSLTNNSRNLAIKLHALLDHGNEDDREFFTKAIPLYARVLKDHLQSAATMYMLDDINHPELKALDRDKHVPNQVAMLINNRIILLNKQGKISGEQLLFLNVEVSGFTDICGACERIKNTPIPYSYSAFIKKFIFIYIMTLPLGYAYALGYWTMPVVAVVFYVLASLELIAEEIEDPFGMDSNDLPMEKICENLNRHIAEIL